ncbi:MAG: hypothetical protein ACF788_06990 [Novipirellula sp. JB048]
MNPTHSHYASLLTLALLALTSSGCSGATDQREEMVEIRGRVHVDGEPAPELIVKLYPQGSEASISTGITSEDGSFVISTYRQGDGAPPGEYRVGCEWGTYDRGKRMYTGDQLGGRYASPENSGIVWNVTAGEAFDAGTLDLER